MNLANSMVMDCTEAEEVVDHYLPLVESSISIVAASKIANTSRMDFYRRLRGTVRKYNAQFRYSTNVGAALPILDSIKSILNNGDTDRAHRGSAFGDAKRDLQRTPSRGYPSAGGPRCARARLSPNPTRAWTWSGLDVARKLLILVREPGLPWSWSRSRWNRSVPAALDPTAWR